MIRKIISLLTAVTFAVYIILLPSQALAATYQALKIGTALYDASKAVPVASTIVNGALVASRATPWGSMIGVGMILASMYVAGQDNAGTQIGALVKGTTAPRTVPSGWTVSADPANPTPPATSTIIAGYVTNTAGATGNYPDVLAATTAACATYNSTYKYPSKTQNSYTPVTADWKPVSGTYVYCSNGSGTSGSTQVSPNVYCQPGYSVNAGNCNITTPLSVLFPTEGTPYIQPNTAGTGFVADPRRPDVMPTNVPTSGPLVVNGLDSTGSRVQTTITPTSTGYNVDQLIQSVDSLNNTITQANHLTVKNDGTVTSVSQDTKPGAIAQYSTTTTTINGVSGSTPTDYNREATQQSVLDELKASTAPTMADQTAIVNAQKSADQTNQDNLIQGVKDGITQDKNLWFSWVWTPEMGQCTDPSQTFTGFGRTDTMTWSFCDKLHYLKDAFGWAFALYGAWDIYTEIFRRPD